MEGAGFDAKPLQPQSAVVTKTKLFWSVRKTVKTVYLASVCLSSVRPSIRLSAWNK